MSRTITGGDLPDHQHRRRAPPTRPPHPTRQRRTRPPQPGHLRAPRRLHLRQAAARAWELLLPTYRSFQTRLAALPETDPATTLTRDRWTTVLLRELGYDLEAIPNIQIEDDTFDVRHLDGHVPVHMLGWNVDLDKRATTNIRGASRTAPHSLIQELLNRTDAHLWAILTNGKRLRLLRDNIVMGRPAYIEFDLEGMFTGEQFADFAILYALAHATRLRSEQPAECILEQWRTTAINDGTRALEHLRDGVSKRSRPLAPASWNTPTTENSATCLPQTRCRRRLLPLAPPPRLPAHLCSLPRTETCFTPKHASEVPTADTPTTSRPLDSARLATGDGPDATTTSGVPPSSSMRSAPTAADLGPARLRLRSLSPPTSRSPQPLQDQQRVTSPSHRLPLATARPVDRNAPPRRLQEPRLRGTGQRLRSPPRIRPYRRSRRPHTSRSTVKAATPARPPAPTTPPPNSSKSSSTSPSTPSSTTASAGRPGSRPPAQSPSVTPPAAPDTSSSPQLDASPAGSPRAHRRPRADPDAMRDALRDVVAHCIYGVDLSDLAAELAKVSLWLEALTPGRPLAFLDSHIKVGNGLIGATPALLAKNIPDLAFKPPKGDDVSGATPVPALASRPANTQAGPRSSRRPTRHSVRTRKPSNSRSWARSVSTWATATSHTPSQPRLRRRLQQQTLKASAVKPPPGDEPRTRPASSAPRWSPTPGAPRSFGHSTECTRVTLSPMKCSSCCRRIRMSRHSSRDAR